ncbi:MAG: aminotransferase class V-fold PLP-dependent enzyme [Planctomycetota bacterium]|nr:aminotransferase class V-fold PLP-dependent enzyme [Planctomycetota bacterium]
MKLPAPSPLFEHWSLSPERVFLNHGSFGATPRVVQQAQARLRAELEDEPVRFFVERHWGEMDRARAALASFVRCRPDDLALIPNASIGVATVLANLRLSPGDEILINAHEYPACQNAVRHAGAKAGARVTLADVPFPIRDPAQVVDAYLRARTPRTRLALVSHVTSPTGLVLPVEQVVPALQEHGVDVLVDGAHAPGMVASLDLGTLRPAYYTANCHKWICSPKGSAMLYVRDDRREGFRPLALSNNAEKPRADRSVFHTEFDYVGTQDYTGVYCIADALEAVPRISADWPVHMARNRALCLEARAMLCRAWGVEPPAPESMIGSIATIILPAHDPDRRARLAARPTRYHDALQDALLGRHGIQVPVWGLGGGTDRFLRISAQAYNSAAQYEYLAHAVREELAREREL